MSESLSIPEQILFGGFFVAFVGDTGCGKTTTMTWYAYWTHERIQQEQLDVGIYSNYEFVDIPDELEWHYTKLEHPDELLDLINNPDAIGFCFIDELWRWVLDSYGATSNAKRQYDDICSNARKGGIGFFASSQRFMRIDPNFRDNVHYVVFPTLFYDLFNRPFRVGVIVANNQTGRQEDAFTYDPNPVFRMFKTREQIQRHDNVLAISMEELTEKFDEFNTIYKEDVNGMKIPIAKQKVTQPLVDLFLMKQELYYRMTKDERRILKTMIERTEL